MGHIYYVQDGRKQLEELESSDGTTLCGGEHSRHFIHRACQTLTYENKARIACNIIYMIHQSTTSHHTHNNLQ